MWQTYRQRFWWMQILILGVCAALKGYAGSPWTNIGVFFVIMQMSAVIGAWYGTRLARRIQEISERKPGDRP